MQCNSDSGFFISVCNETKATLKKPKHLEKKDYNIKQNHNKLCNMLDDTTIGTTLYSEDKPL